jgi:hypothetical protein
MVGCGKLHEPVICIVPNQTPSGIEKTWCIKSSTSITRHNVNSCIICPSEVFCLCTHTIVLHPEEEKKNETKPSQFLCIRSEPRIEAHGPKFTDGCKFTRTQVHKNPSSHGPKFTRTQVHKWTHVHMNQVHGKFRKGGNIRREPPIKDGFGL